MTLTGYISEVTQSLSVTTQSAHTKDRVKSQMVDMTHKLRREETLTLDCVKSDSNPSRDSSTVPISPSHVTRCKRTHFTGSPEKTISGGFCFAPSKHSEKCTTLRYISIVR